MMTPSPRTASKSPLLEDAVPRADACSSAWSPSTFLAGCRSPSPGGFASLPPLAQSGNASGMASISGQIELTASWTLDGGQAPCEDDDAHETVVECEGDTGDEAVVDGDISPSRRRSCIGVYYLIYCVTCFALTSALLVFALWENFAPRAEARFWRRRLRPWEEATEAFVGTALCTETYVVIRRDMACRSQRGGRKSFWDCWRVLDVIVAGLTVLCGAFFLLRRVIHHVGDVVEDIDVPVLGVRFLLQPMRMATMVLRVRRIRKAAREPAIKAQVFDPRKPCPGLKPALSACVASQVRELLPPYLRFSQWRLAYSPRIHGTSMSTFYRRQSGSNLLVIKDAHGGVFGGFVSEGWRPQSGSYGVGEAFVFVVHSPHSGAERSTMGDMDRVGNTSGSLSPRRTAALLSSEAAAAIDGGLSPSRTDALLPSVTATEPRVEAFWAIPEKGRLIQWSDSKMLGLGHALVIHDEFLRGSTSRDDTFGSMPLSPAGTEFVIADFECWHVGEREGDSSSE